MAPPSHPDRNGMKINVNASRRDDLRSSTIGFIIKDYDARALIAYGRRIGDCSVVITECEAVVRQL